MIWVLRGTSVANVPSDGTRQQKQEGRKSLVYRWCDRTISWFTSRKRTGKN